MARERVVSMRCTDRELEHLNELARERGITRTDLLRGLLTSALVHAAGGTGRFTTPEPTPEQMPV